MIYLPERRRVPLGGIELIMITILIACAVVLIVLFSKKKNEDLPPTPTYRPPMTPPAPMVTPAPRPTASPSPVVIRSSPTFRPPVSPVMPPPVPSGSPVTSNQHTLYMFERRVSVPKCPRCDGEYDITKEVCCICGYQFRKGVRYS